jgi:hypothetical protein
MTSWYHEVKPADTDNAILDCSELACPKCGCNDVIILRMPSPGSWYRSSGKGRCQECSEMFPLRVDEEQSPTNRL